MSETPEGRPGPEGAVSTVVFLALIGVVLAQVAGRFEGLPSMVWTEEAARWLWVWFALLGVAEVERTGGHLRMSILTDLLPPRPRRWVEAAFDLVWLLAVAQLLWIAWGTVGRTMRNQSVTLPVPDGVLYAAALAATALMLGRIAQRLVRRLR